MGRPRRIIEVTLALTLASACSGTSETAPRPEGVPQGNGAQDSSVTTDAAVSASPDAGSGYRACSESADRFRAKTDASPSASFSLLSHGLEVHVAYLTPTCIGVDGNGTAAGIRYLKLMSTGAVSAPVDVAYADGASCVRVQHPALASVEGKLSLAYSAASAGPWAVYGRGIEQAEQQLSGARELMGISALETENVAGQSFTAWVEDATSGSEIWVAGTQGEAPEHVLVAREEGYHVTALALRGLPQVGKGKVRAALVFASDSASRTGVFLLALDAALKPVSREVVTLSDDNPGAVSLDLQARGVLYTGGSATTPDLRYRALNELAAPVGDEVRITDASEHASVGSLTPFTVGYAIAYRSVQPDKPLRAWLRLSLIDPQGNLAGYRNLFETSAGGGKVLIRSAVDGRLALGFREVSTDGTSELHVARITCGS